MFKNFDEAIKTLGREQALNDLNRGYKQRLYRKDRNMKRDALIDLVKGDAEIQAILAKRQKAS